jgi:hypothetical protein
MNDREWAEVIGLIYDGDSRNAPDQQEMARLIASWRTHCGVGVKDLAEAKARITEYYGKGGRFMKPYDLARRSRIPADQGTRQAVDRACPWPECSCTHTYPCRNGWMEVDSDGFRPGELARGSQLRREAAQRGLSPLEALRWAGNILINEFGQPPAAGALAAPCPRCRGEQAGILEETGVSRDCRAHQLRKRGRR